MRQPFTAYLKKIALLLLSVLLVHPGTAGAVSTEGKYFVFAFQPNIFSLLSLTEKPEVSLHISSKVGASGVVSVLGLDVEEPFSVLPGDVVKVLLPIEAADMPSGEPVQRAVVVQADANISVYGLNSNAQTSDAFVALPVEAAGSDYMAVGYFRWAQNFEQVSIVAIYDNTEVKLAPHFISPYTYTVRNGVPSTITLNAGDVYIYTPLWSEFGQWLGEWDFSGSRITSSAPIAVMGGVKCGLVPFRIRYCDHMTEQVPPLSTWGERFVTVPSATRPLGDAVRVLASKDNTDVYINGELVTTLGEGELYDSIRAERLFIRTTEPALVVQYAVGAVYDGAVADPFMMIVPPVEQYLNSYNFISLGAANGFDRNFVNVVVPSEDVNAVRLDGVPVDPALFEPIYESGYSGAQVPLEQGQHNIGGDGPVGIFVYGFGEYDSYGYPGGMNFDLINQQGDSFAPNLLAAPFDNRIEVVVGDSEDINLNQLLDQGEDLNANGVIDRRTEDVNANGVLDAGEDLNGDGEIDQDSGIYRIILSDDAVNLQLDLSSFVPGTLRTAFTVRPIDPGLPAHGLVKVQDGAGNAATYSATFEQNERVLSNVRLISTLSTDRIELDTSSFAVTPSQIQSAEGKTVIEWAFDSISIGQLERLDYDVIVRDAEASETRVVTHNLEIYYNDIDGNLVHQVFGEQKVAVLASAFDAALLASSTAVTAGQDIELTGSITNKSQFDAAATYQAVLLDADGVVVRELMVPVSVQIAAQAGQPLSLPSFNVGDLYLGNYLIRLIVRDESGDMAAQSDAPFSIVSDGQPLYGAKVAADKLAYKPGETAKLFNRVSNSAKNTMLTGASAQTRVQSNSGEVVWQQQQDIPTINVASFFEFEQQLNLADLEPGEYRIVLEVMDDADQVKAASEYGIRLLSTQDTGVGVLAALNVQPGTALRTENVTISASLENAGNSDIVGTPINLAIVDVASQQQLVDWSLGDVSLARQAQVLFSRQWASSAASDSSLMLVLTGEFDGEVRVLASQPLALAEKFISSLAAEGRGRVLVLADASPTEGKQCRGLSEVTMAFRPGRLWQADDRVTVELMDEIGARVDLEEIRVGDAAEGANVNQSLADELNIDALEAAALKLSIVPPGSKAALTGDSYQIRVTLNHEGGTEEYSSDYVSTACGDVNAGDDLSAAMTVEAVYGLDVNEPHGPDRLPGLASQQKALQTLLTEAGWQYHFSSDAEDFEAELRDGGYAAVLLLSEQIKLSKALQQTLVDMVADGTGLVVAGAHDNRNVGLDQALGVKTVGTLVGAKTIDTREPLLGEPGDVASLMFADTASRIRMLSAQPQGWFVGDDGDLSPAITLNVSEAGRSILFAFDLLQHVGGDRSTPQWGQWLTAALSAVQPQSQTLITNAAVPVTLTIDNMGASTAGEARLVLPGNLELLDAGGASLLPSGELFRGLSFPEESPASWTFWVRLPAQPGSVTISGTLSVIDADGALVEYGPLGATLTVEAR